MDAKFECANSLSKSKTLKSLILCLLQSRFAKELLTYKNFTMFKEGIVNVKQFMILQL